MINNEDGNFDDLETIMNRLPQHDDIDHNTIPNCLKCNS